MVVLLLLVTGCERTDERPPVDTVDAPSPVTSVDSLASPPELHGWNEAAGPALFVPADVPDVALAIFPGVAGVLPSDAHASFDGASLRGSRVELFARDGSVERAVVVVGDDGDSAGECPGWPRLALQSPGGSLASHTWTVGFIEGRGAPVPLDSLEALASPDSIRLTTEIARLASTIASEPDPAFSGLPFSVRSARRFEVAPGVEGLAAEVVRKITTEANPREERTLLIAERARGREGERYAFAYFERSAGAEESVVTPDVLAAVRIGGATAPTLIVSRDDGRTMRYGFLERIRPGQWRARWTSAYSSC